MYDAIGPKDHAHAHTQNRYAVIPSAEKLKANSLYTGRGVTIAFLDSGFYPHPDAADRVIAFHDVSDEERSFRTRPPAAHHWHGTQTVVSCAGNGQLSDGIYRGLACESKLVLVKVSEDGRVGDRSIEKGLRWLIENRDKYDIRVLNMSLGGDADLATSESCVNLLVEQLVAAGVVVTVAAGNSVGSHSIPPANSPSVVTVGGYSDENQFEIDGFDLYHSNHGMTADGLVKPEIIAPAMYVAAPILPETPDYQAAETLSLLMALPDYGFRMLLDEVWQEAALDRAVLDLDTSAAREAVERELRRRKIVATHYQHVDGTSFAAPITASVAAQMLEANPRLSPAAVKNILISTAVKLAGHPSIRQGFGVLNAGLAVDMARNEKHHLDASSYFPPRIERDRIEFSYHNDEARKVALCGDFNDWRRDAIAFSRNGDDTWRASIPCQPAGKYRYKLLIDDIRWSEDPSHGYKEEDGFGGFHSILLID